MRFGDLIKTMLESRGFTQTSLAAKVGVSSKTIQRGMLADKCTWRRSLSVAVLRVLDAEVPLSANEREKYAALTGLTALARTAEQSVQKPLHERAAAKQAVQRSDVAQLIANTDEERTAHFWLMELIEHGGATTVLSVLRNCAELMKLELSPPITAQSPRGNLVYISQFLDKPSGMQITEYTPIDPSQVNKRASGIKAQPLKPGTRATPKGRTG